MNASWGALEPRRAMEQKKLSFVSFGDGEPAVRAFAQSKQSPARGVLWNIHGYLEENSARPVVNWENLPVPAWNLFDHQGYRPSAHRYRLLPTLPVFASRSCPYGCDFCPQSLFNPSQKHIARSPQKVFAEIVELRNIYGIQDLEFYDPTFGIRREETIELCTLLCDLDLQWSCYTRCDLVDESLLDLMKKAGCHTILFGVESEDEEIRGRTNKELSKDAITAAFSLCKQKGIQTIASFIIGLPKETPQSINRTLSFAKKLNPTYAQFHLARSFFAHEEWISAGRIEEDWEVTDASVNGKAYIPHGFTQRSLSRYLLKSYLSFYLRPQKMVELFQTLENRNDVLRHLRGVQQIYRHIVG